MSGDELRAQSAVFIADGTGLAHEYTGAYPHAAYDMGNLDYHREMIPGYDAAGMYMGHSAENMYSSAAYADPSVYHSAHAAYPQAVVSCGYPAFPPQALMSHEAYPGLESSAHSPSGRGGVVIGPNGKPKRRRVATIAQRRAANIRERRRMFNLNEAFDLLRKRVPTFAYEKRLSRIETLRLAITYISFMADIVDGKNPKDIKLLSLKGASGINWSLPMKKEDADEDDIEDDEVNDDEEKKTENGLSSIQPVSPTASESEGRDIPVTAE